MGAKPHPSVTNMGEAPRDGYIYWRTGRTTGGGVGGKDERFWDVDVVRGVAITMVVFYHLIFDLDNLGGYPIESTSGFWAVFADTSAFLFVFLAGLSLSISQARAGAAERRLFGKYLSRGLRIFGYGMLITFVFLALDFGYVIFGILHLIGVSIILAYPLLKLGYANLVLGLCVIAAGIYVQTQDFVVGGAAGVLLAPLGVLPEGLVHAGLPSAPAVVRRGALGAVLRQRRVPGLEKEVATVPGAARRGTPRISR